MMSFGRAYALAILLPIAVCAAIAAVLGQLWLAFYLDVCFAFWLAFGRHATRRD